MYADWVDGTEHGNYYRVWGVGLREFSGTVPDASGKFLEQREPCGRFSEVSICISVL